MTQRPTVTASYTEEARTVENWNGAQMISYPGVHVTVEFALHEHAAALAALDRATSNIRAQIEETQTDE